MILERLSLFLGACLGGVLFLTTPAFCDGWGRVEDQVHAGMPSFKMTPDQLKTFGKSQDAWIRLTPEQQALIERDLGKRTSWLHVYDMRGGRDFDDCTCELTSAGWLVQRDRIEVERVASDEELEADVTDAESEILGDFPPPLLAKRKAFLAEQERRKAN